MFGNLDEQIERGQGRKSTTWERLLQCAGVLCWWAPCSLAGYTSESSFCNELL